MGAMALSGASCKHLLNPHCQLHKWTSCTFIVIVDFSIRISRGSLEIIWYSLDSVQSEQRVNIQILQILHSLFRQRTGYYVEPTFIETSDPADRIMRDEIFGPVVAAYVYPDDKYDDIVKFIDDTSSYSLTGSLFADDR